MRHAPPPPPPSSLAISNFASPLFPPDRGKINGALLWLGVQMGGGEGRRMDRGGVGKGMWEVYEEKSVCGYGEPFWKICIE